MATEQGSVLLMEADGEPGPHFMAREYTGSLDAALTLVPDRYRWSVKGDGTGTLPFSYTAKVGERGNEPSWNDHYSFPCATPALALCAAALRAKAGES